MDELFAEIRDAANVIASPNWAAIVSAIAATGAVVVAIIVAFMQNKILQKQNAISKKQVEISELQNKIALFEMRYTAFSEIRKFVSFIDLTVAFRELSIKSLLEVVLDLMEYSGVVLEDNLDLSQDIEPYLLRTKRILFKIPYLFPGVKEADVRNLDSTFSIFFKGLIHSIEKEPDIKVKDYLGRDKCNFSLSCFYFVGEYAKAMKKYLYIDMMENRERQG